MRSAIDRVLYFDASETVVVSRLTARRTCKGCGAVYHLQFSPPKVAGVCDKCGGTDLEQRSDDQEEAIRNRLRVYASETEPLVGHYRKTGLLREIRAELPPQEVTREVAARLSKG